MTEQSHVIPARMQQYEGGPTGREIVSVEVRRFSYSARIAADADGHLHPGPEREESMTVLRIATQDGSEGYCFGIQPESLKVARPLLLGRDAFDRELIWRDLRRAGRIYRKELSDVDLGAVDQALWDLAGRHFHQPIRRLLGGYRDRVPAYASTMCGDDLDDGLSSPAAYAAFAVQCQNAGYTAFKLHTWMPPFVPDVRHDIAACQAVREAVGSEMNLMLDPHHDYSREEALYLGRALEELEFHWLEEPMDEHSVSSYVWLADQLDIPIIGPESAEGRMQTRAEWITRHASDISRIDVWHGGITTAIKTAHLCEAFGVRLEVHYTGAGNLQVLGAMAIPGEYYERGLLHPSVSYEDRTPWLRSPVDPMTDDGFVKVSELPGLGEDIDWSFIEANALEGWN
jgi:L-alanine-DL-glutamate epimerase-like enolase superfamily enzyme